MTGLDPIEVDIQRTDGVHRVEIRYDSSGILDAARVGFYVDGEEVDVNPTTFDLTAEEEAYFADKFLTQLAEDAADRRAEERGEKWG